MKNVFIILILVSVTENLAISVTKIQQNKPEQRILLRKLQNIQQSDSKDSKSTTWNEILADVLVNKIKIFSLKEPSIELIETDKDSGGNNKIVTKCFSQLLKFFKTYIYDRHINKTSSDIFSNESQEFTLDTTTTPELETNSGTDQDTNSYNNPKDEVELIEPVYHGKFKVNSTLKPTEANYNQTETPDATVNNELETTTEEEESSDITEEITSTEKSEASNKTTRDLTDTVTKLSSTPEDVETFDAMSDANFTVCPNELILVEGQCVSPLSKLILSIPFKCPAGYRKDGWGYCRLIF